jgi:transposase
MKARYCACLGVKRDRESFDIGFVCALGIGGTAVNVRYRVGLNQEERDQLHKMLSGGRHAARKFKRAQILLAADAGESDEAIAANISVGGSTVYRTKRRFVEGNLELALSEEPRPGATRKLSGKEQALLVATACSSPPQGRARWTLELLAGEMVKLTEHRELSRETVRRRLEENELKPWRQDMWCIPESLRPRRRGSMTCTNRHSICRTCQMEWTTNSRFHSPSVRCRPQARRLRRPASRLRGLTSAAQRELGVDAIDGMFCAPSQREV